MRGYILPVLLVAVGLLQSVRIERVAANEPSQPSAVSPTAAEESQPSAAKTTKDRWAFDEPYFIEPPDILLIEAVKLDPKSSHRLESLDVLMIRVEGGAEHLRIADAYAVDEEGNLNFGLDYGQFHVAGLPMDQACESLREHLELANPGAKVSVSLTVAGGVQQIVGEHLVGPDGRVNLGTYGSVYLTGLTLDNAKRTLEKHLSTYMVDPKLTVDVFAYNSKKCYIITKGRGFGDNVVTAPVTGNETVLDAITAIGGLDQEKQHKVWIARPATNGAGVEMILPVDVEAIIKGSDDATNHRLLPGDRVFIEPAGYVEPIEPAPPAPAPPMVQATAYQQEAEGQTSPTGKTKVKLLLVRDAERNLRSIEGLESDPAIVADTTLLKGMIDVLSRNQLATVLAGPTVTTVEGQPAEFGVDNAAVQLDVALVSRHGRGVTVHEVKADFRLAGKRRMIDTAVALKRGQSCLFRLPELAKGKGEPDLYLLISGEPVP